MRIIFILLLLSSFRVYAQEGIQVEAGSFGIDEEKALIVINDDITEINQQFPGNKTEIKLSALHFQFIAPIQTLQKGIAHPVIYPPSGKQYTLFFSELPIIKMYVTEEIVNTPKVAGYFELSHPDFPLVASTIGVEYRGSFSQGYPKKSMEIEFWTDAINRGEQKFSLLGMKEKDSWNLQALFNEPVRINSKVSNELWLMMHTPYYLSEAPEAKSGITMKFSELFLNNQYQGVYAVSEKVNRSLLQLKKDKDGVVRGELFKGKSWEGTTFENLIRYNNNNTFWNGFEYKYPNDLIDWSSLYRFIAFVMHTDDEEFTRNYSSVFNLSNAVDYFIFLNVVRATDNTGKNIYIARYDTGTPFFFVPWDLDGTFGTIFDGSRENITEDKLSNGLYKRLWRDATFRNLLKVRWNALRETILSNASLHQLLSTFYHYLLENAVYEREAMAWEGYHFRETDWMYMNVWLDDRLAYLDVEFNKPFLHETHADVDIEFYPNPAHDYLIVINQDIMQTIRMTDLNGKLIQTVEPNTFRKRIDLSMVHPGMYILQIICQNKVSYIKVQKI